MSTGLDADTAAGRTLGAEEEFLLVDPVTGMPVPHAAAVLAHARERPPSASDTVLAPELMTTQVESATGVCTTLEGLRQQIHHGRRVLGAAARAEGARLLSAGAPVAAGTAAPTSNGDRFDRIATTYRGILADYQTCGCHIHVGVPDHDTAVAVVNHLRQWIPTLLALSGNSPFQQAQDTGYASWRMVQQSRFPGSGVPPRFGSAAEHDEQVSRLIDCGILVHADMSFWLARPSPHLPTVEFRVADAAITAEETVLQAALSRALVRTALARIEAGHEAPAFDDQIAAAAVWSAARHGLSGPGIHPLRTCRVAAEDLVHELVEYAAPALAEAGDLSFVRGAISLLQRRGIGAQRQRAAADGEFEAVIRMLTADTDEEPDQGLSG